MTHKLLIVDDDEEIRTQMKWALGKDYEILLAEDRVSALAQFKSGHPAVTLLDLGLPPSPNATEEGMATLAGILTMDRSAKVIIISGQGDKENAARAVGAGAYDFHCKPVEMDDLRLILQRCIHVSELEREYRELQDGEQPDVFEGILGASPQMKAVFRTIRKVAQSTAPVLILGDSGTGKEMVANAIHRQSGRKDRPFVAVNCNAIPENLLESELFGHEKGSFTGAHTRRKGLIEEAAGGSLFLDEIGDLAAPVQVKLLRFLQEKKIQRVGGREEIHVELRVMTATHVDLDQAMRDGSFREDLYFRLAVVECRLPPLRERGDDVLLLAQDFLRRFGEQNGREGLSFSPAAKRAINKHAWPGNVRELQNKIQRAIIMCDGQRLDVSDLELADESELMPATSLKEAREDVEREMVMNALSKHGGKIAPAAEELGVSRPTLYELMDKLNIERKKK